MKYLLSCLFILSFASSLSAQQYTHADTLRGSNGSGRSWWDVQHYGLHVTLHETQKSVLGNVLMAIKIIGTPGDSLQIDLQQPMVLDSAFWNNSKAKILQEGDVGWVIDDFKNGKNATENLVNLYFHGKPKEAQLPPWDGGLIWGKDSSGNSWNSVACQGTGASTWWPGKDLQSDEPDFGMTFHFSSIENSLPIISNGKQLVSENGQYNFEVKNPINTYDATFYQGDYAHYQDTFQGEKGMLTLDFYPLKPNLEKAKQHWTVTKQMLRCFEYWLGPYPFYEDGYKLVEAPFLGMEHQSAVAYGNQYKMGYLGRDLSGIGVGLLFDFIIVHESGHEWWGNSVTAADVADNWIHEGITTYTETLFAEWIAGKKAAYQYIRNQGRKVKNDEPVIGPYGVHKEGSGDMYNKGAMVMHMIRVMMKDDTKFRGLMRGMGMDFYHRIVTTKQIEDYIISYSKLPLASFFDQYLRHKEVPKLIVTNSGWFGRKIYKFQLVGCEDDLVIPVCLDKGKRTVLSTKMLTIRARDLVNGWEDLLEDFFGVEIAGLKHILTLLSPYPFT